MFCAASEVLEEWDIKVKSADASSSDASSVKSKAEMAEVIDPGLRDSPRAAVVSLTSPDKPATVRSG